MFSTPTKTIFLTLFAFVAITLAFTNKVAAQIIWQEDFSGYSDKQTEGQNKNTANPAADWTSNAGDCDGGGSIINKIWVGDDWWGTTTAGEFRVNDIEGITCCGVGGFSDNEILTEVIDISAFNLARFSMDARETGTLEPCSGVCDNAEDPFDITISIDGGPFQFVSNNGKNCDDFNTINISEEFIQGNTLQVKIRAGNKGGDENLYIDNLLVEGIPDFVLTVGSGCVNSNISATVSGGSSSTNYTYNWSSTGFVTNSANQATYNFTSTGIQTVSVDITVGNSTYTLSKTVNITNGNLDVALTNSSPYCQNDTFELKVTGPDAASAQFVWDNPQNTRIGDASGNPKAYVFESASTTTGTFPITVDVSNNGCVTNLSTNVTIAPAPQITTTASPQVLCNAGETSTLVVTDIGGGINQFIWSDKRDFSNVLNPGGGTSISVSPTDDQYFYIQASDGTCTTIDSLLIGIYEIGLPDEVFVCQSGGSSVTLTANGYSGSSTFEWDNNIDFSSTPSPFSSTSTITANFTSSQTVYVRVTDGSCVKIDSTEIKVINYQLPPPTTYICQLGGSATLTATSGISSSKYVWSQNSTFSPVLSLNNSITVNPNQAKTYYLKITTETCEFTEQFTVAPFNIPILENKIICPNTSATLGPNNPADFPNSSYTWDFEPEIGGQINASNPVVTPNTTKPFYVTFSTGQCDIKLKQTVFVDAMNELLEAYPDEIFVCDPNQPLELVANSQAAGSKFYWGNNLSYTPLLNDHEQDSIIEYYAAAHSLVLYVKALSKNNCFFEDQITVKSPGTIPPIEGNTTFCYGDSIKLKIDRTLFDVIPNEIYWGPLDIIRELPAEGDSIFVFTERYMEVYADFTYPNGCVKRSKRFIGPSGVNYFFPNLEVLDEEVFMNDTFEVAFTNPNILYTFEWEPVGIANDSFNVVQPHIADSALDYITLISKDALCERRDSIFLLPYYQRHECGPVYVPNAFTPNGDEENDFLFVRGKNISELLFRVYDRWGKMVFESTSPDIGWDGKFKGASLDGAVYVYRVEGKCTEGEVFRFNGNVTLIR